MVLNCVHSYDYIHSIKQFQDGAPLTEIDGFLLHTCWKYIPFRQITPADLSKPYLAVNLVNEAYDDLLSKLYDALNRPEPMVSDAKIYILEKIAQLLNIPDLPSLNRHANRIVDYLINQIKSSNASSQDQQQPSLNHILLKALATLANNPHLVAILRHRNIAHELKPFIEPNTDPAHRQLAFAVLAQIMDENTTIEHPDRIMTEFISQLKHLDPHGYNDQADLSLTSIRGSLCQLRHLYFATFVSCSF